MLATRSMLTNLNFYSEIWSGGKQFQQILNAILYISTSNIFTTKFKCFVKQSVYHKALDQG